MQEYRGIQLMLREAHIPFDIVEDGQIANLEEKIKNYKLIILPEITFLKPEAIRVLKEASLSGTNLIATSRSISDSPESLKILFGARVINKENDGAGNYMVPDNRKVFKRFAGQKMIFWKYNLGLYDLSEADERFLPILSKGRPGPPEIIGGHEPTGFYAMGIKKHPNSKAIIFPENLGKIYYMHGYQQHKNLLLDAIEYILPEASTLIQTNAPARIETVLKQFTKNTLQASGKSTPDGYILHLINLTGFSGNTYFPPLPVTNLNFKIKLDKKPLKVIALTTGKPLRYVWKEGFIHFDINKLNGFESIVMEW